MNIKNMIPFLEEEELADLARSILAGQTTDIRLETLLPFMDEDDVDEIAVEALNSGIAAGKLLPFVSEESAAAMARAAAEKGDSIVPFLPFMDEDDIDELVVEEELDGYEAALPFMSEEGVGQLCEKLLERGYDCAALLPFMDDDDIDERFVQMAELGLQNRSWYPFVSEDGWHEVLEKYLDGEIEFDFDDAYRFMDSDDVRELFRHEMAVLDAAEDD